MARPPGTGSGPAVANVHLIGGPGCQIRASGQTFPAVAGLPLLAADEMVVPIGEFLLVALGNGHLVRIDEDITLRVSEIVLLGVPPTKENLTAQLDRLLTKKERIQSERISGVQARRHGAEELPVETSDPRASARPPTTRGLNVERDPGAAPPPPPNAQPPPPPPNVQPMPMPSGRPANQPGRVPEKNNSAGAPPPSPVSVAEPTKGAVLSRGDAPERRKTGDGSAQNIELPKREQITKCLQGALLPTISRVTVEVKLHAGRIVRVRLRGGLVTPACMSRLLLKTSLVGAEETWLPSAIALH